MMDAILSSALLVHLSLSMAAIGATLGWALADHRYLEPERQRLLAEQEAEDLRFLWMQTKPMGDASQITANQINPSVITSARLFG